MSFWTLLYFLAEYSLNARPITPQSSDSSDVEAIAPNHFLLGNQATVVPSTDGVDVFDHRKRYTSAQSFVNATFSQWFREFIPALNLRSKFLTPADHHLMIHE